MKNTICIVLFCLQTGLSQAAIYQWTDSSGDVHFSDKPRPGAKQVNLPPIQTYTPVKPAPVRSVQTGKKEEKNSYQSITIAEPPNETTSRDNQGRVPVLVETSPPLKPGDRIQITLDGRPIGEPQESTTFLLDNVYRGTHTIGAQIVDKQGNVILQTEEPTLLFMQRPRTGMTPNTPPPLGR